MTIDRGLEDGKDRDWYMAQAIKNGIPQDIFSRRLAKRGNIPGMTMKKASTYGFINKSGPMTDNEMEKILIYAQSHTQQETSVKFCRGVSTVRRLIRDRSASVGCVSDLAHWGFA